MKDLDLYITEELTQSEVEQLYYKWYGNKKITKDQLAQFSKWQDDHKEEYDKLSKVWDKNLRDKINKANDVIEKNEKKMWINLPYTFDIYNKGPKNKDFIFGIRTMQRLFHGAWHWETKVVDDPKYGTISKSTHEHYYEDEINCELPPDFIHYKDMLDPKDATKNFTKLPEIEHYVWAYGMYFSKPGERPSWNDMCESWREYFDMIFTQYKGKVSMTLCEDPNEADHLLLKFADPKIRKEIDEKLKEMSDIKNIKNIETEWNAKLDKKASEYRKNWEHKAYEYETTQWIEYLNDEVKKLTDEMLQNKASQRDIDYKVGDLLNELYGRRHPKEIYWGD